MSYQNLGSYHLDRAAYWRTKGNRERAALNDQLARHYLELACKLACATEEPGNG